MDRPCRRARAAAFVVAVLISSSALAVSAEIPNAVVVLEAAAGTPGSDAKAAAPPRLVLLKDGQVFVGGTARLETARLDKPEQQALRRAAEVVRKAAGRDGTVAFGADNARTMSLRMPGEDKAQVVITGDPAAASPEQAPVAVALQQLLRFDHASLQPYKPASYALSAREGSLAGGCRSWAFAFPVEQVATAPVSVPAAEAEGWPTGALPASVCSGAKRYVVTLRPLLPGEQP